MAWLDNIPATRGWVKQQLKEQENRMNNAIAAFRDRVTVALAKADQDIATLKQNSADENAELTKDAQQLALDATQIQGLKDKQVALEATIADLQAKVAAGTFAAEDEAVLADVEAKYQAVVAELDALVAPAPPATPAAPEPTPPATAGE